MNNQVVFIAGLGHSGSTLLDLILGGHPDFVGLGELSLVLKRDAHDVRDLARSLCSCGAEMGDCIFWKKVIDRFVSGDLTDRSVRLNVVLETFHEVFGPGKILVDSSKYLPDLIWMNRQPSLAMSAIHIIKDVRAFTVSQIDNARRKGRRVSPKTRFELFWRWHAGNKRIIEYASTQRLTYLKVGYEELCLYPTEMVRKVCDFLGKSFDPTMLDLGKSRSHSVLGNRMRHQNSKHSIRYDPRWLVRREWLMPALVFPHILSFNSANTYSNGLAEIWKS